MSKSICSKCGKDISKNMIYRVYVKRLLPYSRNVKPLNTMDLCSRCYNKSTIEIVEKKKAESIKIEKPTFIFNPIKRTLRDTNWDHTYNLTELENKLLEILSNGRMNTWADLNKYVYPGGYRNKFATGDIKNRLIEKTPLSIRIVKKGGLIIDDKILIDY